MSREVEADGFVTLGEVSIGKEKEGWGTPEKQEIWETEEFILGVTQAIKGCLLVSEGEMDRFCDWYGYSEIQYKTYVKGWNFGNAIINPILARIEMEKD